MNVEGEIIELKRRLDELESEVAGEKILSRHIFEAVKRTETKVDRMEKDLASARTEVEELRQEVGDLRRNLGLNRAELRCLRDDLPAMITDALRSVLT